MGHRILAATANEACSMLVREVYRSIVPDLPGFCESSSLDELANKLDSFLDANGADVDRRITEVSVRANSDEWSRIITLADTERANIQEAITDEKDSGTITVVSLSWNAENLELSRNGSSLGNLASQTGNTTRTILGAFQEDGWPDLIDDPTSDREQRKGAIRTLNEKFTEVQFYTKGDKIGWKNTP